MNKPKNQNGTLTNEPEHGYVWTTFCLKCGTVQRIKIGDISAELATQRVAEFDVCPKECPGGYHVEIGGWKRLYSLDLMLNHLRVAQAASEGAA